MYADVSIMSPETMRRKTPIAMVTPVGIAEGVEVDNVSVVVILGSVTKEPKFQQRYDILQI